MKAIHFAAYGNPAEELHDGQSFGTKHTACETKEPES